MKKYEVLFITKPDLPEEDKKALFGQINDVIAKYNGKVLSANIWAEKRKLYFPIKRQREGLYYLLQFNAETPTLKDIRHAYQLNENILRALIIKIE